MIQTTEYQSLVSKLHTLSLMLLGYRSLSEQIEIHAEIDAIRQRCRELEAAANLEQHIKTQNDKTRAWVAQDPTNRWAALPVERADHWAKYGVTTPEQYDHYMLVVSVYDTTKDVLGYRPDWSMLTAKSNDELEKMLTRLSQ